MYSCDELFMRSLECYFGVYFPRCCATREINTKITLSWAHKQFATQVHTLFYILSTGCTAAILVLYFTCPGFSAIIQCSWASSDYFVSGICGLILLKIDFLVCSYRCRRGVVVGDTSILVYAQPMSGRRWAGVQQGVAFSYTCVKKCDVNGAETRFY